MIVKILSIADTDLLEERDIWRREDWFTHDDKVGFKQYWGNTDHKIVQWFEEQREIRGRV